MMERKHCVSRSLPNLCDAMAIVAKKTEVRTWNCHVLKWFTFLRSVKVSQLSYGTHPCLVVHC